MLAEVKQLEWSFHKQADRYVCFRTRIILYRPVLPVRAGENQKLRGSPLRP